MNSLFTASALIIGLTASAYSWGQKCQALKGGAYTALSKTSERMASFDITTAVYRGDLYPSNYGPQLLIEDLAAPLESPQIYKVKKDVIKFEYKYTQRGLHLTNWTGKVLLDRMTKGSYRISIIDMDSCNKYVRQIYLAEKVDFSGEAKFEDSAPEIKSLRVLPLFSGSHSIRVEAVDSGSGLERAELISDGVLKGTLYFSDRHGHNSLAWYRGEQEINRIASRQSGAFELEGVSLSASDLANKQNVIRVYDVHGNFADQEVPKEPSK